MQSFSFLIWSSFFSHPFFFIVILILLTALFLSLILPTDILRWRFGFTILLNMKNWFYLLKVYVDPILFDSHLFKIFLRHMMIFLLLYLYFCRQVLMSYYWWFCNFLNYKLNFFVFRSELLKQINFCQEEDPGSWLLHFIFLSLL